MKRLALTALLAAALIACQPSQGPAGTVIDRDKRALTVRTPDGTETRFTVSKKTARSCPPGAAYPQCADNPSWTRRSETSPDKTRRSGPRRR